jgi:hypothetical protein
MKCKCGASLVFDLWIDWGAEEEDFSVACEDHCGFTQIFTSAVDLGDFLNDHKD